MIYTSYYAKMKKFPENCIPVAISQGIPKWYNGIIFKDLAPDWKTVMDYKKSSLSEEEKEQNYVTDYERTVLNKETPLQILEKLETLLSEGRKETPLYDRKDIHIILLCYEKSEDFCHRKLVAKWLKEAGIPCREITDEDIGKEKKSLEKEETGRDR